MSSGVCHFSDRTGLYWVKSLFWNSHKETAHMMRILAFSWGPFMSACATGAGVVVASCVWVLDERAFRTLLTAPEEIHCGHKTPGQRTVQSVWPASWAAGHLSTHSPQQPATQGHALYHTPEGDSRGLRALTFGQVLISGHLKLWQVNKISLLDSGQCCGGADGQAGGNLYNDLKTHKAFWTSNVSYRAPLWWVKSKWIRTRWIKFALKYTQD